jgi:hypothetical protein
MSISSFLRLGLPRLTLAVVSVVASATAIVPRIAAAQSSTAADGSAVGVTRFEMQRGLLEIDEQRRRLETSLEPLDSVLRVLSHDSTRIAGFTRPAVVDHGVERVVALMHQLRTAPDSGELVMRFVDAVTSTTRDFTEGESSLGSRMLAAPAAQDYLARSPHAAVVPLDSTLPPRDTPLWDKIRASDYGKRALPRVTFADLASFREAVSDSGFQRYRDALLAAFTKRIAEVRQTRDAERAEIQRLRRKAADMAHAIGSQDENAGLAEAHAVNVGLPVFAVVFITLLLAPRVYRNPELQQWIFTSGIMLEITTLVTIVAGMLVLALAGKINEAVIGTMLGGVLGYGVGRGTSKRVDLMMPAAPVARAGQPALPIVANGQRV